MSQPPKLVVDASVIVKWYVPEVGSTAAVAILTGGGTLLAPDLLVAELGNVLWKKVRRGELRPDEAGEIADAFVATAPVALQPSTPILRAAFDLSCAFGCTVYDALYLSLAVLEGCQLVSADNQLSRALQGTSLEGVVEPLASP